MKKFIKKNALFLSALVVVIIIILIIAISNRPSVTYKMTKDNLVTLLKGMHCWRKRKVPWLWSISVRSKNIVKGI
ncbi:MAG: hypothetical protein IPH45_14790 [Bacteroidales bacterium]|nr:hypothetical protein [Bacteroidales bacterium]